MIRTRTVIAALALAGTSFGCDFEVSNPGPTPDEFLERPEAHQAVANGAAMLLFDGLNNVAYTTAAITRELFPAGSTSSFGISASQQVGILRYDDEHVGWTSQQRARSVAELGFARFETARDGDIAGYRPAAEAALWAGYANRLLGENWCEAVIDGGAPQPGRVWLERAEDWFTKAIEVAGTSAALENIATAAYAGRASVRIHLDDWTGALEDAARVPTGFVFNANYHATEQDHYNRIFFAGANQPYRAHTVWNTHNFEYFRSTGDARVAWDSLPGFPLGDAALGFMNSERVPFYRQQKYRAAEADIRLSSGREMRLIEIEAQMRAGSWEAALAALNARRAELNVPALTASSLNEAWTHFKRERGLELWLEGRRMGDLRRWKAAGTPGDLHPLEQPGNPLSFLSANQTLCYDIPQNERESNPNVPTAP